MIVGYNRWLVAICQRYKLESNSQLLMILTVIAVGWLRYVKDTNLKAIHNVLVVVLALSVLVAICQRYKLESNSQHA